MEDGILTTGKNLNSLGVAEVFPRIIVIGALGRCGRGAVEMAHKMGIPKYAECIHISFHIFLITYDNNCISCKQ